MTQRPPARARSPRASAEIRRGQILEAARRLFAERGFDATSTRHLSTAAGVNDGLLYRHFDNKQAILEALRDEAMAMFAALPSLPSTTTPITADDLAAVLELVGNSFLNVAGDNADLLAILISEHHHLGGDRRFVRFVDDAATGLGALIDPVDTERGYDLARSFIGSLVAFVLLQDVLGLGQIHHVDRVGLVRHLAQQIALPPTNAEADPV